jgi:hypothetical protein
VNAAMQNKILDYCGIYDNNPNINQHFKRDYMIYTVKRLNALANYGSASRKVGDGRKPTKKLEGTIPADPEDFAELAERSQILQ